MRILHRSSWQRFRTNRNRTRKARITNRIGISSYSVSGRSLLYTKVTFSVVLVLDSMYEFPAYTRSLKYATVKYQGQNILSSTYVNFARSPPSFAMQIQKRCRSKCKLFSWQEVCRRKESPAMMSLHPLPSPLPTEKVELSRRSSLSRGRGTEKARTRRTWVSYAHESESAITYAIEMPSDRPCMCKVNT